MIEALAALGALIVAAIAASFAWRVNRASWDTARPIVRGALFFGWGTLSFAIAESVLFRRSIETLPLDRALVGILWFLAASLVASNASRPRWSRRATSLLGLALLVGLDAAAFARDVHASTPITTLGLWSAAHGLTRAMQRRQFPALRTLAHAVTLVSVIGVLLPGAMLWYFERRIEVPPMTGVRAALTLTLGALALCIGIPASSEFVRAGGTPDPLDPPTTLVTRGIYSRLRHPLQAAEILVVCACVCVVPNRWTGMYAVLFAVTLAGPMRWLEEILLRERLGSAAVEYALVTPAFVPRVRSEGTVR